jgi:predicted HTH transcriptional regulator
MYIYIAMSFTHKIVYDWENLQKKICKGEGVSLDFKQTISNKYKIAKTIASFANNKGGSILVGVADSGTIVGIDAEQEMYMLFEASEYLNDPPVDIDFIVYDNLEEDIQVVEAIIANSLKKPHLTVDENGEWHIYIRSEDQSRAASKQMSKYFDNMNHKEKLDSKEKGLLDYLNTNKTVTIKQFAKHLNIGDRRSRQILLDMLDNGYLILHRDSKGDYFTLR